MPISETHRPITTLLADIGGTNTRVALAEDGIVVHKTIRRFANAGRAGLDSILSAYLDEFDKPDCAGACVAAAGLVQDGVAEMTNLDWVITPDALRAVTGAQHVAILNDLQAQGHALEGLRPKSLRMVLPGAASARSGPKLVIGVGTGFNAAVVHRHAGGVLVVASECGHTSLPLRNEPDLQLARHIEAVHGFAGVEDVLSGRGLERLYGWHSKSPNPQSASAIMALIAAREDPDATATAQDFVTFLGRVAGDLALHHLAYGGIYLMGGVARAFAPHLIPFGFDQSFRDKGRFSAFLDDFSVQIIEDDYAALEGCARHLARILAG
jgi:glucokinase